MTSVRRPLSAIKHIKPDIKRRRPQTAIGVSTARDIHFNTIQKDNSVKDFREKSTKLK